MIDVLLDALMDALKIVPYLFVTYLILELLEHKLNNKTENTLKKYKKIGPIAGGLLGALPQCGFGAMCASLFSSRVITVGTLIAVFLSTSDEMLPIMLGEKVDVKTLILIILFKAIIGIVIGFLVDLFINKNTNEEKKKIHEMCEHDHCDCEHHGILLSSIKHTLTVSLFILAANVIIGLLIMFIGEDAISNVLLQKNILVYLLASLIGLIPNCAASVIITELYLGGFITIGVTMAGLLTGSGIGLLMLFKTNKNLKENMTILSIVYLSGVIIGLLVDLFI